MWCIVFKSCIRLFETLTYWFCFAASEQPEEEDYGTGEDVPSGKLHTYKFFLCAEVLLCITGTARQKIFPKRDFRCCYFCIFFSILESLRFAYRIKKGFLHCFNFTNSAIFQIFRSRNLWKKEKKRIFLLLNILKFCNNHMSVFRLIKLLGKQRSGNLKV